MGNSSSRLKDYCVCLYLAGFVACGDAADSSKGDADTISERDTTNVQRPTSDNHRVRVALAFCDYNVRCGVMTASTEALCWASAAAAEETAGQPYDEDAAIAAGKLAVDADAVAACVAASTQADCTSAGQSAFIRACQGVRKGRVDSGGACANYSECKDGVCVGLDECSPGECVAFLSTGAACGGSDGAVCAPSDFCSYASPEAPVCKRFAGLGDACGRVGSCASGTWCKGTLDAATCAEIPGKGEACTSQVGSTHCASGLVCDRSTEPALCVERRDVGGACATHDDCVDGLRCDGGQADFATGVPSVLGECAPIAQVGDGCRAFEDTSLSSACANMAKCDSRTRKCVLERGAPGDVCGTPTTSAACFYAECNGDTQRCVAWAGPGDACFDVDGTTNCEYGLACRSGVCVSVCQQ